MNRFTPIGPYLKKRLLRTSFEEVMEFRQLMLLEQLINRPLRGDLDETLYVGLRTRFPRECHILIAEFHYRGIDRHLSSAMKDTNCVLGTLRESRQTENRERRWRERADWILSGGLP